MATLRHQPHGQIAMPPIVRRDPGGEAAAGFSRLVQLADAPLRLAAGDDVVLLKILRGAAAGSAAAMLLAVIASVIF